jgi:hypothetical protein
MTNKFEHDPMLAEKVEFLISMAGTDIDKALTCLAYALVDIAVDNDIDMVYLFRNLSSMYLSRFEEDENADN